MSNRRLIILMCLWAVVATGFFLLRSSTIFVWDDSPSIAANMYDIPKPLVWGESDTFERIISDSFGSIGGGGYRPLSLIIARIGASIFSNPNANPAAWFTAVGMIFGTLAVCVFLIARRYLQTDTAALLAVFLFLFSTPVITGGWVVFAGIQAIVPLMICLGLLLYWKAVESTRCKGLYMLGLCMVLFFGPWFREYIGVLSLLIIFLEARRARRPTLLMGIAGVFLLHTLFPMALIKLLVYPQLPLVPVFAIGFSGQQLSAMDTDSLMSLIKWSVSDNFLTLFPPIFFGLALIAYLTPALFFGSELLIRIWKKRCFSLDEQHILANIETMKNFFLPLIFIIVAVFGYFGFYDQRMFILWLSLGMAFLAICYDTFLAWWFLLTFLPFLILFTEQVHLAYALLPASIIMAATVEKSWQAVQQLSGDFRFFRYALILIMALVIADHGLNLYGSYEVVHSVNDGILTMADWFKTNVPRGSIVISNAPHAEDIRLYSGGHIIAFWTVTAGIPHPSRALAKPEELEKLIWEYQGKRNVYFLDMDYNYTPVKAAYHSHKYVRDNNVAMEYIGLIHITKARYPYLDPFKAYIPRPLISFLGAPDLENDFYRGPAQDDTPFLREVYTEYHVYKVTGTKVDLWNSSGPLKMVKEGYLGFNIFVLNSRFFAIPQGEGAFDLKKVWRKEYSRSFISDSYLDIVKQIINQSEIEPDAKLQDIVVVNSPWPALPNKLPPGLAYSSGNYTDANTPVGHYKAEYAFDDNINTLWHSPLPAGTLGWIVRNFEKPTKISMFTITIRSDMIDQAPSFFIVSGSSDGKSWSALGATNKLYWEKGERKLFALKENNQYYKFYKFDFISSVADDVFVSIIDMDLFGEQLD
ncbi:discoidin domain-containing protein [bacterium]|nr:discoidin domain-containing protein [bacterium]